MYARLLLGDTEMIVPASVYLTMRESAYMAECEQAFRRHRERGGLIIMARVHDSNVVLPDDLSDGWFVAYINIWATAPFQLHELSWLLPVATGSTD